MHETHIPLAASLPFVVLLGVIAVGPLVAHRWWESNRNKALVAALISLPILLYLGVALGDAGRLILAEKVRDYVSFVVVIGALFVISGGIYLEGSLSGTPLGNTVLMGVGAVLANLAGTTGASVLLIRPLLRANRSRRQTVHIVIFFIFIVSNCGGLLTPLGDPPLLLGFLKGVPFAWTLSLWPQWLTVTLALLAVFNVWDQWALDKEERERRGSQLEQVMQHPPLRIRGLYNLALVAAMLVTIVAAGRAAARGRAWPYGIQEVIIVLIALAAYLVTPKHYRERNAFTFGPLVEVAVLFAGIFITMAPLLEILNEWSQGRREVLGMAFGIAEPWQFFWVTGVLSSFLDNAPTYLTFSASAAGLQGVAAHGAFLSEFLATGPEAGRVLTAISTGAVFMGANTYIGNAPNFMVKAIATEHGVRMPSFFGYMVYSAAVLLPIFVATTLIFF
jgi:Na+/H+ antiporter NhaD/arsenite permease-like protein